MCRFSKPLNCAVWYQNEKNPNKDVNFFIYIFKIFNQTSYKAECRWLWLKDIRRKFGL